MASQTASSPERGSGNYSKHSKTMMMMMPNLTCMENSKYIRHCLSGMNMLSKHNSFSP